MIKSIIGLCFSIASSSLLLGQVGGNKSYEFLNVPYTAQISGLGGVNVSQIDQEVNLFLSNPALTGDTLSGYVAVNYLSYFAEIGLATFTYATKVDKIGGMLSWGIQHIGLGSIDGYDDSGNLTQSFSSAETALTLSHGRRAGNFSMGMNIKWANSNIAGYKSNALFFDLGAVFVHPHRQFNIGMAIKNVGFVLNHYTQESNSKLPLDIQMGTTFKPTYMPFRFSITAHQLINGDKEIAYYEPSNGLQNDEPTRFDKFARHFVIGTELLLSDHINVRLGYNHLVRKELRLATQAGGAGISYGFMIRVKAVEFAYARGGYHVAGGAHQFTMAYNTNNLLRSR